MRALQTIAAAGLIASSLALAPANAQAQAASGVPAAASSFDSYRVVAVTAGVIAGAAVAAIVTDGLIIPVYAYATGAGGISAGGMAHAAGVGAVESVGLSGGAGSGMMGYSVVRGGMRLLGAIGGGFYADSWYTGQ